MGLGVAVCLVLAACGKSDEEKRAEVKSVSVAIDRLRQVPNPNKASMLAALKQVPCSLADVCQLRDRCVGAYQLHVDALGQIEGFKDAGSPPDSEQVTGVEQKLEGARKLVQECLASELEVGRKYGTQI